MIAGDAATEDGFLGVEEAVGENSAEITESTDTLEGAWSGDTVDAEPSVSVGEGWLGPAIGRAALVSPLGLATSSTSSGAAPGAW